MSVWVSIFMCMKQVVKARGFTLVSEDVYVGVFPVGNA